MQKNIAFDNFDNKLQLLMEFPAGDVFMKKY